MRFAEMRPNDWVALLSFLALMGILGALGVELFLQIIGVHT
jgi:hypothetical protein